MSRNDMDFDLVPLADAMEMLVPFWMGELVGCTPGQLQARAVRAATAVGTYGAAIMWGGKPSGQKLGAEARGINALAEGLAAAELLNPGAAREILDKLCAGRGVAS